MNPLRRRRAALLLAAVLGATGASLAPPASAGPVSAAYTCSSPDFNEGQKLAIKFTLDTTAPGTMYVRRSARPTLVVNAKIPGNLVGLASFFGIKSASATGTFTVKINGAAKNQPLTFPRTDIPQSSQDFPITINIPLPSLTPVSAGSIVYTPGPISVSLTGYNKTVAQAQPGDTVGSIAANCSVDNPNQAIDTVRVVRSATTTTGSVAYAKAAKKVTVAAAVASRSGVVPSGKLTAVLYKGASKVRTVTPTLVAGKAKAVFTGIKGKGSYKVTFTYGGSTAHLGSSAGKTFAIR